MERAYNLEKEVSMVTRLFLMLSMLIPSMMLTASWELVEDAFITKPEKELSSFTNRALRWSATGLGGLGGFLGTKKFCNYMGYTTLDIPKIHVPVIPTVSAGASAALTYALVTELSRRAIEKRIIKKFIATWPDKKAQTPYELHSLFDTLYKQHQNDSSDFVEEAAATMRAVKSAVYNHFPDKYRDITNKDVMTMKIFNTNFNWDIGNILLAIAKFVEIFYKKPEITPGAPNSPRYYARK